MYSKTILSRTFVLIPVFLLILSSYCFSGDIKKFQELTPPPGVIVQETGWSSDGPSHSTSTTKTMPAAADPRIKAISDPALGDYLPSEKELLALYKMPEFVKFRKAIMSIEEASLKALGDEYVKRMRIAIETEDRERAKYNYVLYRILQDELSN